MNKLFTLAALAATTTFATPAAATAVLGTSINTGVAPWSVNGNPAAVETTLATPFWVNNYGGASWIGATAGDGNLSGGTLPGSYAFSLDIGALAGGAGSFDLTYAGDNTVAWSITNGTLSGAVTCSNPDCFSAANGAPRSLSGTFGANSILTATVVNLGTSINPMGLIASGTATAAVPEPASWALMIGGFGLIGGVMRQRTRVRAVTFG